MSATDTVADRRVHPATVPLQFLKRAPSTILGLPAAFAFMSRGNWAYVAGLAGVLALVSVAGYWLAWTRFRYGVGARDFAIESGILNRTRRVIPFDRIQDVDIERGPLQRLFGLATVRIETGGAAGDEGLIDSVTLAEADRLRAAVRAGKAGDVRGPVASSSVVPAAPASRTLFAMDLKRVLTAGFFNFSLFYLAALFSFLQTFKRFLPFDIDDPGRWIGLTDERLRDRVTAGAVLAVLLVAVAIGVLFGVARTLASDYGFRLVVEGPRFRRTRGLLTRSEVVLAKTRVQLGLVTTGPLRRAFGWSALHFQTLSGAAAAGQRQAVAPLARPHEIEAILAEQGSLRLPDPAAMRRVSSRHVLRALLRTVLLPTLLIAAASSFRPVFAFAFLLLPPLVAAALLSRRFHLYDLRDDLLFVRRGVWRQRLWIVPVARAQTVTLSCSWLQRRLGLASVLVDTAGAGLNGPRIVDLRADLGRDVLERLSARLRDYSGRKSGTDR